MTDPVDTNALRKPPWSNLDAIGALLDTAADDLDRLHAVIDNAPHQSDCSMQTHAGDCDCWKADAL